MEESQLYNNFRLLKIITFYNIDYFSLDYSDSLQLFITV